MQGTILFQAIKKLNTVLSYSLNLLGGNIYFWKLKHNIAHHTYTNIEGEDHDIKVKFMRLHSDQKAKKYHRFQKYYFPLLYSISYLTWIYYQDYEKYFKQVAGIETFHFPLKEKVIFLDDESYTSFHIYYFSGNLCWVATYVDWIVDLGRRVRFIFSCDFSVGSCCRRNRV